MFRLDLAALITGVGLGLTLSLLASTLTREDVTGRQGAPWFLKPELAEYGCWVVNRHEESTWSIRWPERENQKS